MAAVSLPHGLDDLRQRHLKIAQLDDLNDPFELWAIAQPDQHLRQDIRATKQQMAEQYGLLCFSLDWQNPLLWSHYADRHRGLALGFDVNEQKLNPVSYVKDRPVSRFLFVAPIFVLREQEPMSSFEVNGFRSNWRLLR